MFDKMAAKIKDLAASQRGLACRQAGFSLIELLVVTAIIGVLGVVSAATISSILRSQNKTAITTEVRQNGSRVIEIFERDVRFTRTVCPAAAPCGANIIVLEKADGSGSITWNCSGGNFTRDSASVINSDSVNGVRVESCNFNWTTGGASIPQIVTLDFTLIQAQPGLNQQFNITVPFKVTVGTRAYSH